MCVWLCLSVYVFSFSECVLFFSVCVCPFRLWVNIFSSGKSNALRHAIAVALERLVPDHHDKLAEGWP